MPSNPPRRWPLLGPEPRPASVMLLLTHVDRNDLPARMLPIYLTPWDDREGPCQLVLVGPPCYAPQNLFMGEDVDIAVLQHVVRTECVIAAGWGRYYYSGWSKPATPRYWQVGTLTDGHGWDWSYMDTERDNQRLARWALQMWDAQTPLADGYRLDMCIISGTGAPLDQQGQGHLWVWAWF